MSDKPFSRYALEKPNSWNISANEPICHLIAYAVLHMLPDTNFYVIMPDDEQSEINSIDIIKAEDGDAFKPGILYYKHLDSDCDFDDLTFKCKQVEDEDFWKYEDCTIRQHDVLALITEISGNSNTGNSINYCLYRDKKRLSFCKAEVFRKIVKGQNCLIIRTKDDSELAQIKEEINLEKERLNTVSKLSNENIFEYSFNLRKTTYYNMKTEHPVNALDFKSIYPDDRPLFFHAVRDLMTTSKQERIEIRMLTSKQQYEWFLLSAQSLRNDECSVVSVIGKYSNIHAQKLEEIRLLNEAMRDSLTGVFNKKTFISEVTNRVKNMACDEKSALAIIDLDKFKHLNDANGHLFGDSVLVALCDSLKSELGIKDFVGRFGGDEFLVYFHNVNNEEQIVEKVTNVKKAFYDYVPKMMSGTREITFSMGITLINNNDRRFEEIFDKADKALYYAKENGRDRHCFYNDNLGFEYYSDNKSKLYSKENLHDKSITDDITEFALELLENTVDSKDALNLLLGKIGTRFNFSRITVVEKPYNSEDVEITYKWAKRKFSNSKIEISGIATKENLKTLKKAANAKELIEIPDISMIPDELPHVKNYFASKDIASIIFCPLYYQNDLSGAIAYVSYGKQIKLSEDDRKNLISVSRIIKNHLEKEHAFEQIDEHVKHLVNYDEVSGLIKEAIFKEKSQHKISELQPNETVALVAMDIPKFNIFNEFFGFKNGDLVLKDFADLSLLFPEILFASRGYADNFYFLVSLSTEEEINNFFDRYYKAFLSSEKESFPTYSFELVAGAYIISSKDIDIAFASDNANLAKKEIKAKGISGLKMFTAEMKATKMKENSLISLIDEGIDNNEFVAYLQPKIDLKTGKLIGAEALARWQKPNGILVPPSEFVPLLEKNSRISKLDMFIYKRVVQTISYWKKLGYDLVPISINLSRNNIQNSNVVDEMVAIANRYQVPCSLIDVEITESAFINDQEKLISTIDRLRNAGFSISIDDFGTGYSSLNILTTIPANTIKLDKEFIQSKSDNRSKKLVKNVIQLINETCMDVVCEGVETEEQAAFLKEHGCKFAQGYLYSKPIPVSDFEYKYFDNGGNI
ncbi:MAG: EAL domain-containing protein [Lachnospiraceae bacterium]|nr:EAL domain-containing protein [Lachnospiraceae bacterium]